MKIDLHYDVVFMEIINRIARMSAVSAKLRSGDVQIGLVATMGVIHPGHISLIEAARKMADLVVVSIFINRLQFANDEEFQKYPRDLTRDVDLLSRHNVDYVFAPDEEEMFPPDFSTYIQVENFAEKLFREEAQFQLRGMNTAILKMIHIVRPTFLFLGLKDALQGAVLRKMVKDLSLGTEVVVAPVARHASGLAYGTRNCFLSDAEKAAASVIYRSLQAAEEAMAGGERQAKKIAQEISRILASEPLVKQEYLFLANSENLRPLHRLHGTVLIAVGATVGSTFLNDSLLTEIPTA